MPSTVVDRLSGLTTSVAMKAPVQAVTTGNIVLSGLTPGSITLGAYVTGLADGVTRVLVLAQTDQTQNGIYLASSGAWTRDQDADDNRDFVNGTLVPFSAVPGNGTLYELVCADNPISLGTSLLNFFLQTNPVVSQPQTPYEIAAGVVPTNFVPPAGLSWAYVSRYGGNLAQAIAVAAANEFTLYIDVPIVVAANLVVPETCDLVFVGAGAISVSNTFTLTVNGIVWALNSKAGAFTGAGTVTLNGGATLFQNGGLIINTGGLGVSAGGASIVGSVSLTGGNLSVGGAAATTPVAVTFVGGGNSNVVCSQSNVFKLLFGAGNTTLNPSAPLDGQTIIVRITQDGVGSRTITWPANFKWAGGTPGVLSTAANAVDELTATWYNDTGIWSASLRKGIA